MGVSILTNMSEGESTDFEESEISQNDQQQNNDTNEFDFDNKKVI